MLIECPADRKCSLFDLVELQDELTDVLGIHVQLAEYDSPNERFLARALPDEVSIPRLSHEAYGTRSPYGYRKGYCAD